MDVWFFLQQLNMIKLFNTVFPPGFGELITLLSFIGFFLLICVMTIAWALTKEQITLNSRARISMEDIAAVVYPSGGTREIILPRRSKSHTEKMEGGDHTWTITPEGWMMKSNGVRFTYLHPDLPHNVSLNQLVTFYLGSRVNVVDGDGNIKPIELRSVIRSAQSQDRDIYELAAAQVEDLIDPNKKITQAAIYISLILAVGFVIAVFFLFVPKPDATVTTQVVEKIVEVTTTTIPKVSSIK